LPNNAGNESPSAENFIHQQAHHTDRRVINGNPNDAVVFSQELSEQHEARIHHA
jgi:hypothetical protein